MRLRTTKLYILNYCETPRRWSEIVKSLDLVKGTVEIHTRQLVDLGFLCKVDGKYSLNFKNKKAIKIAKQIGELEKELEMLMK